MPKLFASALLFGCSAFTTTAADRNYSGTGNSDYDRGAAGQPFLRLAAAAYGDGVSSLAGSERPNPRVISNLISGQAGSQLNHRRGSDFIWQWGQFIDHDITFVPASSGEDASMVIVEPSDPLFPIIPMRRSASILDGAGVRQQINAITSFIDGSNVYGSDAVTASALRVYQGGLMKVAADGMLPFNTEGLPMDGIGRVPAEELRMAGDVRANEQPGLTALHTLFVHEHNRLAHQIVQEHPYWDDERIYQRARKLVGAIIQSITYNEWLPALLGSSAPDPCDFRYSSAVDPSVSNEFAGALFRFGHSLVGPRLMRISDDNLPDWQGEVSLAQSFFNPPAIESMAAYEHYLKGLASQHHQAVDMQIIDELRQTLFGPPGSGGLDLAALNIQRGRDHGLADYNSVRMAYGLGPVTWWSEISSDPGVQLKLALLYSDLDNIDLWVGALCEAPLPGSALGELMTVALAREFTRLAEGDAWFYLWDDDLGHQMRDEIKDTTLHDVIGRNTSLTIQPNVFFVPEPAFKFESMEFVPGVGVEITFMGDPGYEYQIKFGSVPGQITEDLLATPLRTGNATHKLKVVDPGELRATGRFYKLERTKIFSES